LELCRNLHIQNAFRAYDLFKDFGAFSKDYKQNLESAQMVLHRIKKNELEIKVHVDPSSITVTVDACRHLNS